MWNVNMRVKKAATTTARLPAALVNTVTETVRTKNPTLYFLTTLIGCYLVFLVVFWLITTHDL